MFNGDVSARIYLSTYPHPTVAAEKITQPKITSHPRPPSGGRSTSSIAVTPFSYTDGAAERASAYLNAFSSSPTSTCVISDRGVSIAGQDGSKGLRGRGEVVADRAFYAVVTFYPAFLYGPQPIGAGDPLEAHDSGRCPSRARPRWTAAACPRNGDCRIILTSIIGPHDEG